MAWRNTICHNNDTNGQLFLYVTTGITTFALPGTSNAFAVVDHRVEKSACNLILPLERSSCHFGGCRPRLYLPLQRRLKQQTEVPCACLKCVIFSHVRVKNCYQLLKLNVENKLAVKIHLWNPFIWTDIIQPLEDDHGRAIFSAAGQRQRDRSLSPCRGSLSVSALMSLLGINIQ